MLGTEVVDEDPNGGKLSFRFVPGPIFSQVVLADEINRTPPKKLRLLYSKLWRKDR